MIKAVSGIVLAAVLALTLTGCDEKTEAADSERVAIGSSLTEPEAPAEEAPEPAETSSPAGNGSILDPDGDLHDVVDLNDLDGSFLESARRVVSGLEGTPDETLIAWGRDACAQLEGGATVDTVQLPDASASTEPLPNWNSSVIAGAASFVYCTEFYTG